MYKESEVTCSKFKLLFCTTEMFLSWCWTWWNLYRLFKVQGKHWKVGILYTIIMGSESYWPLVVMFWYDDYVLKKGGSASQYWKPQFRIIWPNSLDQLEFVTI